MRSIWLLRIINVHYARTHESVGFSNVRFTCGVSRTLLLAGWITAEDYDRIVNAETR